MTTVLFLDSHTHPTCVEKFNGTRRFAASRRWNLVRTICSGRPDHVRKILKKTAAQGCIVNSVEFLDKIPPSVFGSVPVVYLDTDPDLFDSETPVVFHDSYGTGQRAATELMKLGMREFLYMPFHFEAFWCKLRWAGFADRLSQNGLTAVRLPLQASAAAQSVKPLSGILTANDLTAETLIPELKKRGLRIPQDVTIIAADDSDIARNDNLTSIRIDFEHAGYYAAEALANLMENGSCARRRSFGDVSVQYRDSTRHFAHTLPRITEAVAFIRANACNGLTAAAVIEFIGSARRTAEDHFRLATGHTIHQEIQSVRLERVFSLLTTPGQSISSLTDFCGYSTPQALRKAFRIHTGISMNEWRKRLQLSQRHQTSAKQDL